MKNESENFIGCQETQKFDGNPGFGAFAGTFGANICIQFCNIMQGILIARLLGPVGRGEYAAVILWPTTFASLGILGMNTALAQHAAREQDLNKIARSGLLISLITGLVTSGLCFTLLPYLIPQRESHLLSAIYSFLPYIVLNHLALSLISVDQGAGRFRSYNLTRILLYPTYLFFILILWMTGLISVLGFVLALLAANLTVTAIRLWPLVMNNTLQGSIFAPVRIIKRGIRFGLADLINPIYQQADKALILWFLGMSELGIYTVALSAGSAISSLAHSAGTVAFTVVAKCDSGTGFDRVARLFRMNFWIWISAGGGLSVLMPFVLPLIYGREFQPAVWPSIILIPAVALQGQGFILEQALRGQGRAFAGLEGRIAGMIAMMAIGYFASKTWGILGIVLAFSIAQVICLIVLAVQALAYYRIAHPTVLIPAYSDARALVLDAFRILKVFDLRLRSIWQYISSHKAQDEDISEISERHGHI